MSKLPDFLGPFRLARFIRRGNATQIWECIKDDGSGRYILKILRSEFWNDKDETAALRHEFEVASKLDHPNVIRVHEFRVDNKIPYLVLEIFTDLNVKQMMREHGLEKIWVSFDTIVEQCALGLQHLHKAGWVHCDIKPDNFLLDETGNVKLIDFTIAQRITRGKFSAMFRGKRKQIAGTRSYMSPEQIRGEAMDARADIYSFGCLLFELLSGRTPYTGDNPNDLLNKHLRAPVPSVQVFNTNVTPQVSELVSKMIAKRPEDRPSSMTDILRELKGARTFKVAPRLPEKSGEDREDDGPD